MKRLLTILLSLAIICTMAIAPMATNAAASIDNLNDALYFDVDFSTGTADDKTGNYTFNEMISGADLEFEDDEILGRKVVVLDDAGNLIWENNDGYTFQGYDLTNGLTLEMYLYILSDADEYKHNQVFMELNYGSIHFEEYNDPDDCSAGFRCASGTDAKGNFDMCNAYKEGTLPHKEWVHLLGTSDGTNNYFYINGELVAKYEGRPTKTADTRYGSTNAQILMGESIYGSMFGSTIMQGKVALARIYKACATEEQAVVLYENAKGGAAPSEPTPTPEVTEAPSEPTPTPEPQPEIDIPTGDAYTVSFGEVPAFEAGADVNVPLVINGITPDAGIMGFDIVLKPNSDLVSPFVTDADIQAANEGNETLAALNGSNGKWSVSGRIDAEGNLILTVLDENGATTAKPGDEIVISIPYKATAGAQEGAWVTVVTGADGTDGNVKTVEGSGAWALVTAPVETPTPEPEEETPTLEPESETPTPEKVPMPTPNAPLIPEICPTAEPDSCFEKNCFFDAEYKDGSLNDKYGSNMYDCSISPNKTDDDIIPISIVDSFDYELYGTKVAQFRGGGLEYLYEKDDSTDNFIPNPGFRYLNRDFTMEMYVKILNTGWGMAAGTWYENSNITSGWGIQMGYNGAVSGGIGAANQISVIDSDGNLNEGDFVHTTLIGGKARNKWMHIVLTNNAGQNSLYVDGQYIGTAEAAAEQYDCIANKINTAFRVGGYRPRTNQFCLQMDCAYVRLYRTSATHEIAKKLYDNRLGNAPCGTSIDEAEEKLREEFEINCSFWNHINKNADTIIIPNGVTVIPENAFKNFSNLVSVYIPASVTKVEADVFAGCDMLENIYCEAATRPDEWNDLWNDSSFANVHWREKMPIPSPEPTPTIGPESPVFISVYKKPKVSYCLGEEFDFSDIQLRVKKMNGTYEIIGASDVEFENPDPMLSGLQAVRVSYKGVTCQFTVRFAGRSDVRGIKIKSKPNKLTYLQGERFDPSGTAVYAIGPDASVVELLNDDDLMFYGFKNDQAGIITIKVCYMSYYTTSFSIKIKDEKLLSSIIVAKPNKLVYRIGEPFDTTGMVITAKFYDGTMEQVPISNVAITGIENNSTGIKQVTVTYKEKYTNFSIKVS